MTTSEAHPLRPIICDLCGDEVFGPWIPTDKLTQAEASAVIDALEAEVVAT